MAKTPETVNERRTRHRTEARRGGTPPAAVRLARAAREVNAAVGNPPMPDLQPQRVVNNRGGRA